MLKFTLKLFFISIFFSNLFAQDTIQTDFLQKDFKVSLEWLQEKPKSSAKDFFITQYLQNKDLDYEDAKLAYDMRNGRNATLEKVFKQNFGDTLSDEDKFCYNASIEELKETDGRCIALGLASLKKVSLLSFKDINFFITKLDNYHTLKRDLQIIGSKDPLKALIQYESDVFFKIFFGVDNSYKHKYFNQALKPKLLNKLTINKDFSRFIRAVMNDNNLSILQKSFDTLKMNKSLASNIQFDLGLNAINHKNFQVAKEFFSNSYDIAIYRSEKDKALYWLYLTTKNNLFLEELSTSFDVNIYSLYAKELLNIKSLNIKYDIDIEQKDTTYDIHDVFSWLDVTNDIRNNLDENKLLKYSSLFSSNETKPHLAVVLERFNKYQIGYFITPFKDLIEKYGIYKEVLIYSIARQESRFIPSSVSFSGAQGVMQIMPFLSKDIAKKLNNEYNIYEQFIPSKNIEYASFHLDSLIKQFDSNPLFIAYAYNGGAGYTRSQLKRGLFKEQNEFEPFLSMEMISFSETREYGKKVLANFYIYNNYLNSENKISLSTIFQNLVWRH